MNKDFSDPLTPEQAAEIAALETLSDNDIDTTDIPEVRDFSGFRRGTIMRTGQNHQPYQQIGERLRLALQVVGASQAEAAITIGITPETLTDLLNGTIAPPPRAASILAKHYEITAEWLYHGEVAGLSQSLAEALQSKIPQRPVSA